MATIGQVSAELDGKQWALTTRIMGKGLLEVNHPLRNAGIKRSIHTCRTGVYFIRPVYRGAHVNAREHQT